MSLCGFLRHIRWPSRRKPSRSSIIQPAADEPAENTKAPTQNAVLDKTKTATVTVHQPSKLEAVGEQTLENPSIAQVVRNTETPTSKPTSTNTPEVIASGLDDATLHASLGSELHGELRRGQRHSLGSYVDVYRGTWFESPGKESQVAIKILRPFARNGDGEYINDRLRKRLLRQSSIWKAISHPNILPFLGYRLGDDPCIVLPWCKNSNLSLYLTYHPELMRPEKITLLHQAAQGIDYLHTRNPPIVHGNICPENVLINDQKVAIVSDFDLSRIIEERTGFTTTGMRNEANRYLAPESLTADRPLSSTIPADVYAFGGLILTAMSGLPPHHRIVGVGTFILAVIQGAIPTPSDHPALPELDPLWKWMRQCWAVEPADRPSMAEIGNMLSIQTKDGELDDGSIAAVPSPPRHFAAAHESDSDFVMVAELLGDLIRETEPGLEKTLHGGFADVARGRWTPPNGTTVPVAIKYLRTVGMQSSNTPREKVARVNKRVDREVIVWRALRSPYILELYGFRSGEQPCLAHQLSDADKLHLLAQAGKGLQYLHEYRPPISHGDIKPSNILIDDENRPRLCDFGLSRFLGEINPELQTSFVGQGTKGYQSPELVRDGVQDLPGDVYAFGCLILEVMSGNAPFYKLKAGKAILITTAGSIPEPSAHPDLPATDPLWGVMRKCWASPTNRPTIQELVRLLEAEVDRRRSTTLDLPIDRSTNVL